MSEVEASGSGVDMSEYERQRLENIAKNRAVLESLGLTGGGQSLLGKSRAAPVQREKREKPVHERRERVQRNVKQPERLDPGAASGSSLDAQMKMAELVAKYSAPVKKD